MLNKAKYAIAATSVALISACGGGGGSSTVNADPQGFWVGQASTGYTVNTAILDNGEVWGIYSSGSTIYGATFGSASTNGSNISIVGTDFNFLTNSSSSGTMTGVITARSSMSLSGNGINVPLTYQSSYETAATAAAATGTWSFSGRSGGYSLVPGSVTIDSVGRFTLNQNNCVTTGSMVPRSGGKNIYNLQLTSSGSNCAIGQSSLSGVTYIDTTVTPNKFISLALTASRNDGLIIIGTKQ